MKRIYATLLFLLCCIGASAQMTDDAVIDYLKSGLASGKTERQIGTELLLKGVTREQIEGIRTKLEAEKHAESNLADQSIAGQVVERHSSSFRRSGGMEGSDGSIPPSNREIIDTAEIYGHSVFNGRTLTFEPNENVATPRNYVLGPGDQVVIEIWGDNEASITRTITPEGRISISQVGPIHLSGLTIKDAQARIRKVLSGKYSGISGGNSNSEVSVTLGQIRTIQVNILGDVVTPGTYRISPFSTVFHALYRAGGVTRTGTLRAIEVVRGGRKLQPVDVYEYLFSGNSKTDIRLEEGDVIIVKPYRNIVRIRGNVRRPMLYEMDDCETLDKLLEYAGGFTGDAYSEDINIVRTAGAQQVLTVAAGDAASFALADGDIVTVGTSLERFSNRLEIRGHVLRPGLYQLGDGIQSVKQLIERAGGLAEDAFKGRAIILRETEDLSLETVSFNPGAVLEGTAEDIVLHRNDVVVISGVHELNDRGTLTINGYVANPGEFKFSDNTTIEDLILQAGGLLDGASTARVDVARRVLDPNSTESSSVLGQTYSFPIENGLAEGSGKGFILEPYDVVSVRRSPGYREQSYVSVEGEVTFPGKYVLISTDEKVSDLIRRAGGITNMAYLKGGLLIRRTTTEEYTLNSATRRLVGHGGGRDSVSVEKLSFSDHYTLGIDLQEAVDNPGSENDLILNANDRIVVPRYLSTVRIQGDVMYPNTVLYMPDRGLSYYINMAGGYGARAKKGKVYIVYMNGNVSRARKSNARIEPGCEIVVPSKEEHEKMTTAEWLAIANSSASLATTIATIGNIIK